MHSVPRMLGPNQDMYSQCAAMQLFLGLPAMLEMGACCARCGLHTVAPQVWDSRTGQLLRTQQGHKGMVTCLMFATSTRLLFSGSIDSTIGIWTEKGVNLQASLGTRCMGWLFMLGATAQRCPDGILAPCQAVKPGQAVHQDSRS